MAVDVDRARSNRAPNQVANQWRGPDYAGEFPTLGFQVIDFIEAKCVIPDGERMGEPYLLTQEMQRNLLHVYRLDPETGRFHYDRGDQLTRPQKWGKGPFSAARICAEAHAEGPVLFDGWDAHGEPVARGWATPWIQIAAYSEDQADNVWRALLSMVREGPLLDEFPDTGEERINLPSSGLIEPVSSSASSRLGNRTTFLAQDQTESMTKQSGGRKLADAQRRNVAGMGGRFHSTANAWDPAEESVAQQTAEDDEPGVYLDDVDPGNGSIRNKRERRKMLRKVYGDSALERGGWVDLERIESEVLALIPRDPAQAERYYFNRKRASEDAAFDPEQWDALADPLHEVPKGAVITIGVDGAQSDDALAIIATEVATGFQWPVGIWEAPPDAPSTYMHPDHEIDGAMSEAFETYTVWRVYVDPQYIKHLLTRWANRWGDKRVIPWPMNRPRQVAWAVRNFAESIAVAYKALTAKPGEDVPQARRSHDGHPAFARHIKNARKQILNVRDDKGRLMHTISKDRPDSPHKMDSAAAAVISDEAANDCITAGEDKSPSRVPVVF